MFHEHRYSYIKKNKNIPKPTHHPFYLSTLGLSVPLFFLSMNVDHQQLTLKLFTFWLPHLWSRMKISNIFFPVVSCQTLFAQSASPIWPGMLDGVQKEQCVHTEMQPSLSLTPLELIYALSSAPWYLAIQFAFHFTAFCTHILHFCWLFFLFVSRFFLIWYMKVNK